MHIAPRYPHKRQVPSLSPVNGINTAGTTLAVPAGAATGSLIIDESATASIAAANLPTITVTPTSSATSSSSIVVVTPTSAESATSSSGSTTNIPIGTVIGACIGAFAALGLLVILVLWCGKREKDMRRRSMMSPNARNVDGDGARRRSRLEAWKRLGDDEDRWEGMNQQPQVKEVEDEKFNMFKKSPSIRTRASEKSTSEYELPPVPVSSYYPGLAEELSGAPPRPFMGRVDNTPPISWDGETVGDDSFLSLKSLRMSTPGNMSPIKDLAIPTPPAIVAGVHSHKWEAAEVVRPEDFETSNPFEDGTPVQRRPSVNNPFFNAQSYRPRSKSLRASSTYNPFGDENSLQELPKAATKRTTRNVESMVTGRSSVTYTTDRAMRSLIAALDLTAEVSEDNGKPRVSVQPSMRSVSTYGDDGDITSIAQFPLPPSSSHAD